MEKSIFEKVTWKQVLFFCLFLIGMDFWRIFNFISGKEIHSMLWLSISVGLLLIAMAVFVQYKMKEKLALAALGASFIMNWLGNIRLMSIPMSTTLSIMFILGTLYFYRISYKNGERNVRRKSLSMLLIIFFIVIILLPPLFFWLIGMLHNLK